MKKIKKESEKYEDTQSRNTEDSNAGHENEGSGIQNKFQELDEEEFKE